MSTPLWATVADLLESVTPSGPAAELLRIQSMHVDLPMDLTFRQTKEGVELLGSPPRWRLRTAFDRPPGRMRIDISRDMPLDAALEDVPDDGDRSEDADRSGDGGRSKHVDASADVDPSKRIGPSSDTHPSADAVRSSADPYDFDGDAPDSTAAIRSSAGAHPSSDAHPANDGHPSIDADPSIDAHPPIDVKPSNDVNPSADGGEEAA